MSDKTRPEGLRRRSVLQALFALPILLAFRGAWPARTRDGGAPDDIVEINGWILRRSDLS